MFPILRRPSPSRRQPPTNTNRQRLSREERARRQRWEWLELGQSSASNASGIDSIPSQVPVVNRVPTARGIRPSRRPSVADDESALEIVADRVLAQYRALRQSRRDIIYWLMMHGLRNERSELTIAHAVSLLDRFMSRADVDVDGLRAASRACLAIASKYNEDVEILAPRDVASEAYPPPEIARAESVILRVLGYDLSDRTPLHWRYASGEAFAPWRDDPNADKAACMTLMCLFDESALYVGSRRIARGIEEVIRAMARPEATFARLSGDARWVLAAMRNTWRGAGGWLLVTHYAGYAGVVWAIREALLRFE